MLKHKEGFCLLIGWIYIYFLIIFLGTEFLLKYCHTLQEACRGLKTNSFPKKLCC